MANEYVLTKKGKQDMEEQLEYLKTVKRAEISEQIKIARSFGDLSENAEYTEARNEQSRIEGKILDLEKILRVATVVDDNEINLETVGIGTKVRIVELLEDGTQGDEETYSIFGSTESSVDENKISNESPVGKALIGKRVGDETEVAVPDGVLKFRILEISRAEEN